MRGAEEESTAGFMRAPTLMEPFIVPGEEGPAQGERGYKQWWAFALDITQQRHSTLWWFRLPSQAFLFAYSALGQVWLGLNPYFKNPGIDLFHA